MRRLVLALVVSLGCGGSGGAKDGGAGGKRLFVTSLEHNGVFVGFGGMTKGLDGADAFCASVAGSASLGGKWKAWLSDSTTDAISRLDDVGPWVLLNGIKAFESKSSLASLPLVPLEVDEKGTSTKLSRSGVWTGTKTGGTHTATTCGDWSQQSDSGQAGETATTVAWTLSVISQCDNTYRLYCLEQ